MVMGSYTLRAFLDDPGSHVVRTMEWFPNDIDIYLFRRPVTTIAKWLACMSRSGSKGDFAVRLVIKRPDMVMPPARVSDGVSDEDDAEWQGEAEIEEFRKHVEDSVDQLNRTIEGGVDVENKRLIIGMLDRLIWSMYDVEYENVVADFDTSRICANNGPKCISFIAPSKRTSTPDHIIDGFDISICKMALYPDGLGGGIIRTSNEGVLEDIAREVFRVDPAQLESDVAGRVQERIRKYESRGFLAEGDDN